mmetsp:Transcript_70800/g.124948  ORF Transcript_70800/g.124948 Transcript_70800/m.124948 type:complete len:771 (+) Transcript_70800:43-2355(+)
MAFKMQGGGATPWGVHTTSPEESFMSSYISNYVTPPVSFGKQKIRPAGGGGIIRPTGGSRPTTPQMAGRVMFRRSASEASISSIQSDSFDGLRSGAPFGPGTATLTFAAGHTPAAPKFNIAAAGRTPGAALKGQVNASLQVVDKIADIDHSTSIFGGLEDQSFMSNMNESFLNRSATNWANASILNQSVSSNRSVSANFRAPTSQQREVQRRSFDLLEDEDLQRKIRAIFTKHDVNSNGTLGPHETRAMLRALHVDFGLQNPDVAAAERMFKKYDANNSGGLSFDEFTELFVSLLRLAIFDRKALLGRDFFVHKQHGSVWDVYTKVKELGHGTFGNAYLCKPRAGEDRVIKSVRKTRGKVPVQDIEKEILILQQIDHPHVVRLFEWYEDKGNVYLVLEALNGGTLRDAILRQKDVRLGLREEWSQKVMKQVLQGMMYCHSMQVMHKDLKDENIMLLKKDPHFDEPFAIIIDLGIAEMFSLSDPAGRRIGGTPTTMAPEVWVGNFGPKCDVWSLGCIFYQMLSGRLPFLARDGAAGAWRTLHRRGPDWKAVMTSGESRELCRAMLTYNEEARPRMAQCLEHKWFVLEKHRLRFVSGEQFSAMQAYTKQTAIQRAMLMEVAAKIPISRAGQIVEIFEAYDKNGDGSMPLSELKEAFRHMGINDAELVKKTFTALDFNHDGSLSFSEFAAGVLALFCDVVEERLQILFEEYDADRDGCLDENQVAHFLDNARKLIGEGRYSAAMKTMSKSRSQKGKMTFEDLRDLLLGTQAAR